MSGPGLKLGANAGDLSPAAMRAAPKLELVPGVTGETPGGPFWEKILASRHRLPFPRYLHWGRLDALHLLPPDFAFHLGFGTKFMFYAILLRFTYEGLLVSCWAVITEGPNLLDLIFPFRFLVGRAGCPTWIACS